MATGRAIKNRIRSTQSIRQITKAMEAVSAVKMRKSEAAAIKGRPYALHAISILKHIQDSLGELPEGSPLFSAQGGRGKALLVVVTSDKGLAGSFNSNVIRKAEQILKESNADILAIGKRGRDYFARKGKHIVKSYDTIGDYAEMKQAEHISKDIIALFESKTYDKIDVVYTTFISALKQEATLRPLLPLNTDTVRAVIENIIPATGKFSELRETALNDDYDFKFEPNPEEIVKNLVPALVEIEVFHSILEANASEHAARMVAMKNASENAMDMIGSLTISYNKARQAQITKELIEITSGKEALANAE